MADITQPPPPPPPPGDLYGAPRGEIPESLKNDPYFRSGPATTMPGYPMPSAAPPAAAAPARSARPVIALIVAIVAAAGGYYLVSNFILEKKPPSPEAVAAAFVPVAGTTYQEPPPGTTEQVRSFLDVQTGSDFKIEVFDMRALLVGAQPVGVAAIFGVDPDLMVDDYKDEFLVGFRASSGQQLTPVNVGGVDSFEATVAGIGRMYVFFDADKGMIFLIMGQQKDLLERAVTTLGAGRTNN